MLNVVAIMGRLVADPQMRQTQTGKNVASFRIACDRGRKDANGQSQADFFDVVAWDRSAEFVCRYFQKGSLIEIVAGNINFAGPKSSNSGAMGAPAAPVEYSRPAAQQAAPSYSAGSNDDFAVIEDEGDLPF